MDRSWGILAACSLLLAASACGGPDESPTPPPPPSPTSTPTPSTPATTSTRPTFTPAASPAKVTAACPYLGALEFDAITGIAGTVAQEQPPGTTEKVPDYSCAYVAGNQKLDVAPTLYFYAYPKVGPDKPVSAIAKNCTGPSTPLPGVADAAMYCNTGEYWALLAVAKRVHGETRMVTLDFRPQQSEVYTQLAKLLGERL